MCIGSFVIICEYVNICVQLLITHTPPHICICIVYPVLKSHTHIYIYIFGILWKSLIAEAIPSFPEILPIPDLEDIYCLFCWWLGHRGRMPNKGSWPVLQNADHYASEGIFHWCEREIVTVALSIAICSEFEPRSQKGKNTENNVFASAF